MERMFASMTTKEDMVTLHYPFTVVPTSYTIEQGCDKSPSCCSTHGQLANYSGFRSVPYELVVRSS